MTTSQSIAIGFFTAFYSGLPGLWIAEILRKRDSTLFRSTRNFQLTKNTAFYKLLGLDYFAYCIKNSFFRHFNKKIRISKRPNADEVNYLLNEIALSELCHVFGFIVVMISQIIMLTFEAYQTILFSFVFNVIFNIYPVLLQELNKLKFRKLSGYFPGKAIATKHLQSLKS